MITFLTSLVAGFIGYVVIGITLGAIISLVQQRFPDLFRRPFREGDVIVFENNREWPEKFIVEEVEQYWYDIRSLESSTFKRCLLKSDATSYKKVPPPKDVSSDYLELFK